MISVKRFVTERAVDFITILEEDFPRRLCIIVSSSFPRFSVTSLIGYRNFSVLCSCINYFFVNVYFLNLDSLCETVPFFIGNSKQTFVNKLIVFEVAKTNNEMMSSVLSNILGWPGGNHPNRCV